jgi:hypothetical protein
MADARQQLDQTRSRMQQSAEQMDRGQVSNAMNSTTRAQRELEAVRDDFQRRTSSQFESEVRDLRERARDLDQTQQDISDRMRAQVESRQDRRSLTDANAVETLSDRLAQQQDKARDLVDAMKDVTDASETSEPLLSRKLYDTLRRTDTDTLDQALEVTGELVRRNFLTDAQRIEPRAAEGIRTLRDGVEEAAQSVLGDPTDALRQAQEQLDTLIDQVNREVAQAVTQNQSPRQGQGQGQATPSDSNEPGNGQGGQGNPDSERAEERAQERAQGGREGQPGSGQNRQGPITGQGYGAWSDRLRDVEEILDEPDWRNEAAGVRERARALRAEFVRRGAQPQWDLVRQSIMQPLVDLRKQVKDELARLQKDQALVPMDRDPVPGLYEERVKRYFETLGETPGGTVGEEP